MKKIYLMKKPELFQGEKYLKKGKNYFEGWYFKNTNGKDTISFIPGINIDGINKKAFIQVITNKESYYFDYNIEDFVFNHDPFYIKIKDNIFEKEYLKINIEDKDKNIRIYGNIKYENSVNLKTNILSPNIMGPFSYIPFMECNHAILSMKSDIKGSFKINNKNIKFKRGTGYIEKDWGISFPKTYIWLQGNNFKTSNTSFMCSVADIPFKLFNFRGLICVLIIGNKEYKFTTYNNAKIKKYEINDKKINITLKKGKYRLEIETTNNNSSLLSAPIKGKMEKNILESIDSKITITLKNKNRIIYKDTSINCGLEVVS